MRIGSDLSLDSLQVAARQYGVIGNEDLKRDGLSSDAIRRRVRNGQLQEIRPQTFRIPGSAPMYEQDLMAVQVWVGQTCRISHRAAAKLMRLDGFNKEILEITTSRNMRAEDVIVHRVSDVRLFDKSFIGPLVATTPARTLLDLGSVADLDTVEDALECALRRRLTTIGALNWELERSGGQGQPGTKILSELLAVRPKGYVPLASRLEIKIGRTLRITPLPRYVRQLRVETRVGERYPDFAFPEYTVAIEGDGYDSHGGRKAWLYDKQRDRALEALGWDVIHVTWEDITEREEELVADLHLRLCRKGWNPPIQPSL